MTKQVVWHEISATKLAEKMETGDSNSDLQQARGIKYGHHTYGEMYMIEREKSLGHWPHFFAQFCAQQQLKVTGNITVVGINDGQEVAVLPARSIVGFDIAAAALERGRQAFPYIDFKLMDITIGELAAKNADVYLSFRTAHIFFNEQLAHIVSQAYRNLKGGGKAVFSVPGGYMEADGTIVIGQKVEGGVNRQKPFEDAGRIAEAMRVAGFLDVAIVDHGIEIFVVGLRPWSILFVNGSPRSKGNSDQLVTYLMGEAQAMGFSPQSVNLRSKKPAPIAFCTGCDHCHAVKHNVCVFKKDYFTLEVEQRMLDADAVYLVSPSYQAGVTGFMKIFMDRCEVFRKGRLLKNKVCGGAAIGGYAGGGQESILHQMHFFAQILAMRWVGAHGKRRSHLGGHLIGYDKGAVMEDEDGLTSARNVLVEMRSLLEDIAS